MLNLSRQSCVRSCLVLPALPPPDQPLRPKPASQNPALDKQLSRIDLGVVGLGIFNQNSNGTAIINRKRPHTVNLNPSNTAGALVTLRYISLTLRRLRSSTTATPATPRPSPPSAHSPSAASSRTPTSTPWDTSPILPKAVLRIDPLCLWRGWHDRLPAHPRRRPGLPAQARATYYYSVGVETTVLIAPFRPPRPVPPGLLQSARL